MKTAILTSLGIKVLTIDNFETTNNEEIVKVQRCAICGSDLLKKRNKKITTEWGHEIIGFRVRDGQRVIIRTSYPCGKCESCKNGKEYLCQYWKRNEFTGFSEYIKVDSQCAIPIANTDVSDLYILSEPLNVSINMLERATVSSNDRVAIIGNAGIGLMAAIYAKKTYNCEVVVFSRNKSTIRTKICADNGIRIFTMGQLKKELMQYNKIINTAPYEMIPELIENAGYHTTIAFNGISDTACNIVDLSMVHFKNIMLVGCYPHPQNDFRKAMNFIENNSNIMSTIITHVFSLDEIDNAFDVADCEDKEYIKIIIDMEA